MAKDPAFLFYPNDWSGGTGLLSRVHKGAYMDLLVAQFNNGPLSIDDVKFILGPDFDTTWERLSTKFKVDPETGLLFNKRLDDEIKKRAAYSESRRHNLMKKPNEDKKELGQIAHMDAHMDAHMENRNEDRNSLNLSKGGPGGNLPASGSLVFYNPDDLKTEMLNSDAWKVTVCQMAGIDPPQVDAYIVEYCLLQSTADQMGRPLSDFKRHFSNWVRIQVKEKKNKRNNGKSNRITTFTEAANRALGIEA